MKLLISLGNSRTLPSSLPACLVAQTGFLGDVVLTTPLLATLHQHLTPESLTVLTTPQAKPLIEYSSVCFSSIG